MKAFFKSFASAGLAVLFGVGTLGGTAALAEMSEHRGENVPEETRRKSRSRKRSDVPFVDGYERNFDHVQLFSE